MTGERAGERRDSGRAAVEVACTLHRRSGAAIAARTLDLGPGGMRASTRRPLALDEVVTFDLVLDGDVHITGHARVMRHEGGAGYALRFEGLCEPSLRQLEAVRASPSSR